MMRIRLPHPPAIAPKLLVTALAFGLAAPTLLVPGLAAAQDKPAWFVPAAPKPAAAAPTRGRVARPAPTPVADPGGQLADPAQPQDDQAAAAVPQYSLPPLAPLPDLPKTAPPPVAAIGVLGVSDVMRASSAAQMVQKIIGARRDKLNADAQREQATWRDMQQALVNEKGGLSTDQLRVREADLQNRILTAQKTFRARNRVIQEAAQVSLAQVERVLVAVIRQVASSRNMNLVLHREQVALNIADFDITDQVTAQLNAILTTVAIPPDGQEPNAANTGGALVSAAAPAAAPAVAAPVVR